MTPEDDRLGRTIQYAFRSGELGACGRVNALERQFAIEASLGEDFEWAGVAGAFDEVVEPGDRVEAEAGLERLSPLDYAKSQLRGLLGRWLPNHSDSASGADKLAA